MIRDAARRLLRGRAERERLRGARADVLLPFDMFDEAQTAAEADIARKLEGIYHKGQRRAWNGKELLAELVQRHGGVRIAPEERRALAQLFAVILWGELAAWKVSADLAFRLEPLEAKMAATAQAHDEARHFYVMHDYLALLGDVPGSEPRPRRASGLPPATMRVLRGTLEADTLAKKLVGMQMMIEPMALALFQMVRESGVEPVLAELIAYYERDEARHVALGVLHLPRLLRGLTVTEAVDLWTWEFREYLAQMRMLHELEPHFRLLGMDVRRVIEISRNKQIRANQMLMDELGAPHPVMMAFIRIFDAKLEWEWPSRDYPSMRAHLEAVARAALRGTSGVPSVLTDVPA